MKGVACVDTSSYWCRNFFRACCVFSGYTRFTFPSDSHAFFLGEFETAGFLADKGVCCYLSMNINRKKEKRKEQKRKFYFWKMWHNVLHSLYNKTKNPNTTNYESVTNIQMSFFRGMYEGSHLYIWVVFVIGRHFSSSESLVSRTQTFLPHIRPSPPKRRDSDEGIFVGSRSPSSHSGCLTGYN